MSHFLSILVQGYKCININVLVTACLFLVRINYIPYFFVFHEGYFPFPSQFANSLTSIKDSDFSLCILFVSFNSTVRGFGVGVEGFSFDISVS